MKKVLIFILLFIFLLSLTAYAEVTEVPLFVYEQAQGLCTNGKFGISEYSDGFGIAYDFDSNIAKCSSYWASNSINALGDFYFTRYDNVSKTWSEPILTKSSSSNAPLGRVIFSTFDIIDYSGKEVFFSPAQALPLEVNKVVEALGSIVQTAASSSLTILAVAVVLMALMMAVSLIPRVLYRVF